MARSPRCGHPCACLFYLGVPAATAVLPRVVDLVAKPQVSPGPMLLAVRVTGALTARYAPAAAAARRRRAAQLDPAHGAVAEFGVQAPDQLRCEEPHLGGPGRRVGGHRELPVGERIGPGMRRQVLADDLRPAAEDRAHRGLLLPAAAVEQAADGGGQPLRVIAAHPPLARGV